MIFLLSGSAKKMRMIKAFAAVAAIIVMAACSSTEQQAAAPATTTVTPDRSLIPPECQRGVLRHRYTNSAGMP
jgi:hypothetical protein